MGCKAKKAMSYGHKYELLKQVWMIAYMWRVLK